MAERLERVDNRDVPVKPVLRHTAHAKGLRHRAVHILVFNKKGEIFVQRRSRAKDVYPRYYEASLSGHVRAGEEYDKAALRELDEELGLELSAKDLELLGDFELETKKEKERVALFVVKGVREVRFLEKGEVEEGAFMPLEQLHAEIKKGEKQFTLGTLKALNFFSSRQ